MDYKLIAFKEKYPSIHESVFLAAGVIIAADVTIAENSNIWFNSVIRGDVAPVIIGKNTNIQDGTVIHTSRFDGPTHIGDNITVGHMALLHACTVEDNAFIGMQAAVMDKAIIEEYGFVGAGSLVPPGKVVKRKELWMGRPAKFVRMVTDEEIDFMRGNVQNYLDLSNEYKNKHK
jgi:carbonic anhydrase/acetyltransferase-like protein (isoleucine patch superfamily)